MGGIPQGYTLSMHGLHRCFVSAWCRYLEAVPGISPQLFADNLKCVSSSLEALLELLVGLTGWLLELVTLGRSSWMSWIWVVTLTLFVGVHLPCAGGLMVLFVELLLCMPCLWTTGASLGFSVLCLFQLLCVALRQVLSLMVVCVSFAQLLCGLLCPVVSPWPNLELFLLCSMDHWVRSCLSCCLVHVSCGAKLPGQKC